VGKEIEKNIIKAIKKYLFPERIILFGSRAKNMNRIASDFDIAVECEEVDITTERKIKEEIDRFIGLHSVDLVFINRLDKEFQNIIFKTGKVIYEKGRD